MTAPIYADVLAAAERIAPFIRETPIHTSETLDGLAGRKLFFKCELFQKTGSFKYRGATNAVQKLSKEVASFRDPRAQSLARRGRKSVRRPRKGPIVSGSGRLPAEPG